MKKEVKKELPFSLVKSLEIEISYSRFYTYLNERNLSTLVEWVHTAKDALREADRESDEYDTDGAGFISKIMQFIVDIDPYVDFEERLSYHLGLSPLMRLESFVTQSEREAIYLDFRGDDIQVELSRLMDTQHIPESDDD
jgi:hypothetical protein